MSGRIQDQGSGGGRVPGEGPPHKGVGVTVPHLILRLEIADDCHVLVETTIDDDLLPLGNRATVLLVN